MSVWVSSKSLEVRKMTQLATMIHDAMRLMHNGKLASATDAIKRKLFQISGLGANSDGTPTEPEIVLLDETKVVHFFREHEIGQPASAIYWLSWCCEAIDPPPADQTG